MNVADIANWMLQILQILQRCVQSVTGVFYDIMDCQLNEFEDFLNEIKNELMLLKHDVIAFVHNAELPDIE